MTTVKKVFSVFSFSILLFCSCQAYKYGYTSREALNKYLPVTGDDSNFGDQRLGYNQSFHRNSALTGFLSCMGRPDYIYEYNEEKKRSIRLYYLKPDSVYCFQEPAKGKPNSIYLYGRAINKYEKEMMVKGTLRR
jgi:hypothetical protein